MTTEDSMRAIANSLTEALACPRDGTRLRFGDLECPRCGEDIEGVLRAWASRLLAALGI